MNSALRIIAFITAPLLLVTLAIGLEINSAHAAPASPSKPSKASKPKVAAKPATPAKPMLGGTRPTIPGGDENRTMDPARQAAMQKYQDCLTATGVKLPQFGRGGFGRGAGANNGARPTGAPTSRPTSPPTNFPQPTRPTLTPEQQAALDKCAPLRPAFGRGGFGGTGGTGGNRPPSGVNPANPANPVKPVKPVKPAAPGMQPGAAYITCLNNNGVNVKTNAEIAGLDQQSPKIAAALAKCASKK